MAFVYLDTDNLLQDEPLTSPEVLAMYQNLAEALKGADGAPRLAPKIIALDAVGNSGILTISGLDDYQGLMLIGTSEFGASGNTVTVQSSKDGGSTFSSARTIYDDSSFSLDNVFIDFLSGQILIADGPATPQTLSDPGASITDIRINTSSAVVGLAWLAWANGGQSET